MKPAKLDLPTIWRGCDWGPVTLKWKNANGDPINLTPNPTTGAAWKPRAFTLNFNLNAAIVNPVLGETRILLSRSQTASLKLGVERWDWIWEHVIGFPPIVDYRYPPFLSGMIAIADPVTTIPPEIPPSVPSGDEVEESEIDSPAFEPPSLVP
jgi:hypothetical protein